MPLGPGVTLDPCFVFLQLLFPSMKRRPCPHLSCLHDSWEADGGPLFPDGDVEADWIGHSHQLGQGWDLQSPERAGWDSAQCCVSSPGW